MAAGCQRRRLIVTGRVQGVGFRPHIYRLATRLGLTGTVANSGGRLEVEVQGDGRLVGEFVRQIESCPPVMSDVRSVETQTLPIKGDETAFSIKSSASEPGDRWLAADIAVCPHCLKEVLDPANRRWRYPFTNCTDCGPRYTIMRGLPYDRARTAMAGFNMCPVCAAEYKTPGDRRFHAQPNACPECGPRLSLIGPGGVLARQDEALHRAAAGLKVGAILAVKGLGGFHLACLANDDRTVVALRERKRRPSKPLAVMVPDVEAARRQAEVSATEAAALTSWRRPAVLLNRRPDATLSTHVAPGLDRVGLMLPYTPLHALLLEEVGAPLIMTSGNVAGEPIVTEGGDARSRLAGVADFFLDHDRPVVVGCDDSVVQLAAGRRLTWRRARGWSPEPVGLAHMAPPLFAAGGQLKNSFCLAGGRRAWLSQYVGDLDSETTLRRYEALVNHLEQVLGVTPEIAAHDGHPDYLSTLYARSLGLKTVAVQHHHAHVTAVMAEHGLEGPVLGLAFDGAGYGTDGRVWGGEVLLARYDGFERLAHFQYVPMAGGEAAVRRPARMAASYLATLLGPQVLSGINLTLGDGQLAVICRQLEAGINSPLTSSCGRLFDAVAACLGLCPEVSYEGQAAAELEAAAWPQPDHPYPMPIGQPPRGPAQVELGPLFAAVLDDLRAGAGRAVIAGRVHLSVADLCLRVCNHFRRERDLDAVVLAGGVWQNRLLLELTWPRLKEAGFRVYTGEEVPVNDGGIALGQAAVAGALAGGGG